MVLSDVDIKRYIAAGKIKIAPDLPPEQFAQVKAAQLAAQEAWHEMSVATRERKALDQLRDKFRRAYDNDVQRDEQKELDEMGLRLNSSASNQSESVPTLMEKI